MLTSAPTRLSNELADVKTVVQWQHRLRETIHSPTAGAAPLTLDPASLSLLQDSSPNRVSWQQFDHCAAITRIYALFEKAISDLVGEYLSLMPRLCPDYCQLNNDMRVHYRIGVGQILGKWSAAQPLYTHLTEEVIAAGLVDGLRKQPYSLLADAFLTDSDNYRVATLQKLFKRFGFDDAYACVRDNTDIKDFCNRRLGSETADSFLNEFVRTRNEAAHGAASSIAGVGEITNYADFVVLVVDALATLLRTRIVREGVDAGCSEHLATVLHAYSDNIVGIKALSTATIAVGDNLFAGKKQIEPVTVISLQIVDAEHAAISLTPGVQIGVKLDKQIPAGSGLYRWI